MSVLLVFLIIAVAGLTGLLVFLCWKLNRLKRAERRHRDKAPYGLIRQKQDNAPVWLSAVASDMLGLKSHASPEEIGSVFVKHQREIFFDCLTALHTQNKEFSMTFDARERRQSFHLKGVRIEKGVEIWLEDASLLRRLEQIADKRQSQIDALQGLFDCMPMPVWWRRADNLQLAGCNRKYCELLAVTREQILAKQIELGRGVIAGNGLRLARRAAKSSRLQSESHYLVVEGKRLLFDFNEMPLPDSGKYILGYATDVTHIEEHQTILATHVAANDQVLEKIGTAIAIFGSDRRLKFFNDAYLTMWNLNAGLIHEDMFFGEVLELLRIRRQLPEIIDFPGFKRAAEAKFQTLIEAEEDLQHLPDERTIRRVISPHPLGGLMFTFEDVTDRLALERSYNTLIEVQQETLNSLYEGVAVFGSDGRLGVWNKVYADLWGLPESALRAAPHVSEILDMSKHQFARGKSWEKRRRNLILSVTEPKPHQRRISRMDGVVLDVAHVPLPDGQCLVLYQDVTNAAKVERALEERNKAFEKADLLKSRFVANVSYELRTPLNVIQGFSEILHSQHFGKLNKRQRSHVESILDASNMLWGLISDVLDLAALQAGFMQIEARQNDFLKTLTHMVEQQKQRIEERRLAFHFHCDPQIGLLFYDDKRMFQILRNICDNILKFAQRGKTLEIQAGLEEEYLQVRFIAGGSVDSEEDRMFLARRFEDDDAHALRVGAGLGLSLAKSLIDLHDGKMMLNMDGAGGVEISFHMPIVEHRSGRVRIARKADEG